MTLSAGDPWATVLASQAVEWAAQLERTRPELGAVTVCVEGGTVVVTASGDPWPAVTVIATEVAPWWPGWLHPAGVGCRIRAGGITLTADCEAMFDLAATIALG